MKGLRAATNAFWAAGIKEIYIDGSFCTEKPDPGDIDGYWVEPDSEVYERMDPYWIDFTPVLAQPTRKWKCRMWADHGVEFFFAAESLGWLRRSIAVRVYIDDLTV